MKNATRRRVRVGLLSFAAFLACRGEQTSEDLPSPPDTARAATPVAEWRIAEAARRGFRAFAWGSGDTLWGIHRGRLAWATADSTAVLPYIAWDVQAAPGIVSWTNEHGLWGRTAAGVRSLAAPRQDADYIGPAVSWSPSGNRALLTWTGEGGTIHGVLDADSVRRLHMTLPGIAGAEEAVWLDDARVATIVVAWSPIAGPGEHREAGYRSDVAVIDIVEDRIESVSSAADGEYYMLEGVLADTLLVGVRTDSGVAQRHMLLSAGTRNVVRAPIGPGRAAAAHGYVALLRPAAGSDAEPAWLLDILNGSSAHGIVNLQGYAVRLLWHPQRPLLAVAQESEAAGMRTWLVARD